MLKLSQILPTQENVEKFQKTVETNVKKTARIAGHVVQDTIVAGDKVFNSKKPLPEAISDAISKAILPEHFKQHLITLEDDVKSYIDKAAETPVKKPASRKKKS